MWPHHRPHLRRQGSSAGSAAAFRTASRRPPRPTASPGKGSGFSRWLGRGNRGGMCRRAHDPGKTSGWRIRSRSGQGILPARDHGQAVPPMEGAAVTLSLAALLTALAACDLRSGQDRPGSGATWRGAGLRRIRHRHARSAPASPPMPLRPWSESFLAANRRSGRSDSNCPQFFRFPGRVGPWLKLCGNSISSGVRVNDRAGSCRGIGAVRD